MRTLDPVETVIAAFDRVNLVALGERHWAREDSEFRLRLIRDPSFAQKANDIVVEFCNPLHQQLLDRFVSGEDVPPAELRKAWQDTTQPGTWDSPVYAESLKAVRAVNAKLAPGKRLRVVAGDYPIDWTRVSAIDDLPDPDGRDRAAADAIRREVLGRNRRALVLFGSAHLYRNRSGTIPDLLRDDPRAKWFVVSPIGGPDLPAPIAASQGTSVEQSLLESAGEAMGDLNAADVLEKGTKRIKVMDGKPVFADGKPVFVPVFESDIKVRQLVDACLYFGSTAPEFVSPPTGLTEETEYNEELQRRRKIMSMPRH